MEQSKLDKILKLHKMWLDGDKNGERADLRSADLREADLRRADLRRADLRSANLRSANLRSANLLRADLREADLRHTDLRGANIDFTGFDLACRSCNMKLDIQQIRQILHLVYSQQCDDPEYDKMKYQIYTYVKRWEGLERYDLAIEKPKGRQPNE